MDLNSIMAFDHVVRIDVHGQIHDGPTQLYAPDLCDEELGDSAWTLLNGWSGQYGYRGPIMHDSERIGGRLAEYLLENPGIYVAVAARWSPCGDSDEEAIEGWAVARYCDHSWIAGMVEISPEDADTVDAIRPVTCRICDTRYRPWMRYLPEVL